MYFTLCNVSDITYQIELFKIVFEKPIYLQDYDEDDDGEIHEEKQQGDVLQSSSTAEANHIAETLEKLKDEGKVKGSDVEDGEISDEGEEGEIMSDDQVCKNI